MASTSTNKQPLLVDHVLHKALNLSLATNNGIDVEGANTAALLVDSTTADGALIEDVYLISRGTTPHKVNLYLSTAQDYLRPTQGVFIGQVTAATTAGNVTNLELPRTLTPVPQVGTDPYNHALYIPKGYALWAAIEIETAPTDGPILGVQGGWF